ncbi:hypothetical protein [Luteirhabdus pelagi]|uniref:hypothetical protein n=1 Tax=Luteirhabdus pelagi TaxID=2792783 RepID=UPI00193A55C2|nr:hypothetical protein [Luteirhabdus pelagi]
MANKKSESAFCKVIIDLLWPERVYAKLGRLLGLLSVLSLLKTGFSFGFAKVFEIILSYYKRIVEVTLGWLDPILNNLLNVLGEIFDFQLVINNHWKHIYILLGIYFFRSAEISYKYGYKKTGIFSLFWGIFVGLITSILVGSFDLQNNSYSYNFLVALLPVSGIFCFDLGRQVWISIYDRRMIADIFKEEEKSFQEFFLPIFRRLYAQLIGSIIFVAVMLSFSFLINSKSPFLFISGFLILGMGIYRIFVGISEVQLFKEENETWLEKFDRTSSSSIVKSMFGLIIWVLIFISSSAGLQSFGL